MLRWPTEYAAESGVAYDLPPSDWNPLLGVSNTRLTISIKSFGSTNYCRVSTDCPERFPSLGSIPVICNGSCLILAVRISLRAGYMTAAKQQPTLFIVEKMGGATFRCLPRDYK